MPIQSYREGGRPNGAERLNAPGSRFPGEAPTALVAQVTSMLEEQIYTRIFGTTPDPYFTSLQVLSFDKKPKMFDLDEASWFEMPDQRISIIIDDGASAAGATVTALTPAVVGGDAQIAMPVDAASWAAAKINARLHFKSGGWAVIVAKPSTNVLTIRSLTSLPIPALIQGQAVTMGAEIRADQERRIVNHMRAETLKRTNYITTIMNAREYGRKEWLKLKNANKTNFTDEEKEMIIYNTKCDAMVELWNGNRAMQRNDNGFYAKGTDGIKTQMLNGGVVPLTTSLGNIVAAHEQASFSSNRRSGVTYNIASEEILHTIGKAYKESKVRYEPNSRIADLGLDAIQVASRKHVLIPAEMFPDDAYLPGWEGHYFMIDKTSVEMAGMNGMPFMDINGALTKQLLSFTDNKGSRDDLHTWPVEMTFAPMLIDPPSTQLLLVS